MKRILMAALTVVLAFVLGACAETQPTDDVYVTVYPMRYLVEEIGKGVVTVGTIRGVTSHNEAIDWSPKDIIAMQKAKLIFYVGANYDAYIDLQFEALFADQPVELVKIETVEDREGNLYVPYLEGEAHVHGEETRLTSQIGLDPHFWMSPKRMIMAARLVRDKLIAKVPGKQTQIEASYAELLQSLTELDDAFEAMIATQTKAVMTATNIYTYLHEDYGFEFFSISPGYHEETEQFTTQEKDAIVAEALAHDVRHILFEKNSSSPLSEAVLQALLSSGATVDRLEYHILHALFSDDIDSGEDYESIMETNLRLIETAIKE
jgi:zinc transport system substrate-binding protein